MLLITLDLVEVGEHIVMVNQGKVVLEFVA
jgi:hypothetical protein